MRLFVYVATGSALAVVGASSLALVLVQPSTAVPDVPETLDAAPPESPRAADEEPGFLGVVMAGESVDIASPRAGVLTSVHVRMGGEVARDEIVATLDDRVLRDELDAARAALDAARVAAEKTGLEVAESRERLARYERWQRSAETAVVSDDDLAGLRYKAKYATRELDMARERITEHEARVESLSRMLADASLRAPFAGQVAARYVDPGATVQPGQPIVRLVRGQALLARFAMPAERAVAVQRGMLADVHIAELSTAITGVIENVAPEVDAASRMIMAEVRLDIPARLAREPLIGRVVRVHPRPARN